MNEIFKEIVNQLMKIWNSLTVAQRVLVSSVTLVTIIGLIIIISLPSGVQKKNRLVLLYKNLSSDDMSAVLEKLDQTGIKYQVGDNSSIKVYGKDVYNVKMNMAKDGLPSGDNNTGFELFDKTSFGMTDFQQKLNYKRAIQGELSRTINSLKEVENSRVHYTKRKESLFSDNEEDSKASVTLKLKPGKKLSKQQIQGIVHLVSSAIEGLKPTGVTILDISGKLLTNPYLEDETSSMTSYQQELKAKTSVNLEKKAQSLLDGILGPGKSLVRVSVDINFKKVEQTQEKYNPDGGVVRSKENNNFSNQSAENPSASKKEGKIVNYEIDKTVSHIIEETGNIKRMTISVAVDGKYEKNKKTGEKEYQPRSEEELGRIESLIKNSLGFDVQRADQIVVSSVEFNRDYLENESEEMNNSGKEKMYLQYFKWGASIILIFIFIFIIRSIIKNVISSLVIEKPTYQEIGTLEEEHQVDEDAVKSDNLINNIESFVENDIEVLVASIKVMMDTK